MIKVTLFEDVEKIIEGHDYYVETTCFIRADKAAKDKAKALGVDLAKYSNTALSVINVLKVQAI